MARVRLIHWNRREAAERAGRLRAAGHRVAADVPADRSFLEKLRARPPDAVVIDLGRMPTQGRDMALALRAAKATRALPIVFVEGEPEKVARFKRQVPDAVFTSWRGIRGSLERALSNPPMDPVVPASALAGYSGTPLPKKLGIKPGAVVALLRAPAGFERTLGALPEGASLCRSARGKRDLAIWFVTSLAELKRGTRRMHALAEPGGLWIAWPKKASGVVSDVGEAEVRRHGLAHGLVDYKICAIDATWSGLKFARRKPR